jgi:putative transposase
MFPAECLRETANETGLIKRERMIDPTTIFWVLTLRVCLKIHLDLINGRIIHLN